MPTTILTKEDLQEFKSELLKEIRDLFIPSAKPAADNGKQWLKTYEVKKLLGISAGTLHSMRMKGLISYTRIGGLIFYSYADILKLMNPTKEAPLFKTNHYLTKHRNR